MKFARVVGPTSELLAVGFLVDDTLDVFDDSILTGRPMTDWPGLGNFNYVPIQEPTPEELLEFLPDDEGTGLPRSKIDFVKLQAVAVVPATFDEPNVPGVAVPIGDNPTMTDFLVLKDGVDPR